MKQVDFFFTTLDKIVSSGRQSRVLDHIYTVLDTWMSEYLWVLVEEVLRRVDVNKYDMYVLIGMLTITLNHKIDLPERVDFYNRVKERAERERGRENAEHLLRGFLVHEEG